jgi:uncharacterized repeat protein (TIGR01451 family)
MNLRKFILMFIFGIFLISFVSAAAGTATYYFNSYSAGQVWATNPANMVDGIETSYASTVIQNDVQLLDANNATGIDLGTITSVEIRAYGYYSSDDLVNLVPIFGGANIGDTHADAVPATTGAWGSWFNITVDTNAPTIWTWADVQNLDVDVIYIKSGGGQLTYVGEVEIKVLYTSNTVPVISNISASDSIIKGGNTITIYANTSANLVNDSDLDTLSLYCDSTITPTAANTDCTGGTTSDSTYPYGLTCTFAVPADDTSYIEYCRVYDGTDYSSVVPNVTYITDSTPPSTSTVSVAGDTAASYFDTVNDAHTEINISGGETGMSCKWSPTDLSYSAMSNACAIVGSYALCNVTDVASQGFTSRYVSCVDQYTNENNITNNLDVSFFLDYTAPTTSDDSDTSIYVPDYVVNITELDNVDAEPTTLYCTDIIGSCVPSITIDDGGQITFTSFNRGKNYLRYNSSDDAGNIQTIQNKSININQLPVFTSASDNSTTIKGGWPVNITTYSNDSDSGQTLTLYVCNSTSVSSSGCGDIQYCNGTGSENVSCVFTSESDSATHNWYSFLYDELNEIAIANFSEGYTTDLTSPVITLVNPTNGSTRTQDDVTFTVTVDEVLSSAWYSLDDAVTNITMTNTTLSSYTHANLSIVDGLYNVTFWANDSYGNLGTLTGNFFTINTTGVDLTAPTITVWSPSNNSYNIDGSVLLNITTDEVLSWAGYANDSGTFTDLGNTSWTSWNKTLTFIEGQHDIIFYANDSSNNQGTSFVVVYVDLTNPTVTNLSCPNIGDSANVACTIESTDAIGLDYVIVSHNATGSWTNSSQVDMSGTLNSTTYTILSGNHSPGTFRVKTYVYDLSGRINSTEIDDVVVSDDTYAQVGAIVYSPNTTAGLDPGVTVYINSTITEDYNISIVYLMYQNSSSSGWTYLQMDNNSDLVDGGSSEIVYNASFIPQTENWTIQVNATDFAGNENVSANITFEVLNDSSENIITTIPSVKSITYAQRTNNNSLGRLIMNNTGEGALEFNVSLSSVNLSSRLSVNYTGGLTANYSVSLGETINITIDVNTTGLTEALHDYNVTVVSTLGTTIFEKQLNMQIADGPHLVTSIDTYSSSVTEGQEGVEFVVSVTNLGTADATGVYLNWTLPTGFSLASGSLNRNLGTLGVWISGTNTITVDVADSITPSSVNIFANATSFNADSSSDIKNITISTTVVEVPEEVVTTTSGGGGTSVSGISVGAGKFAVYDKEIEVVRGEDLEFEIEARNRYKNYTLKNVGMVLTGFSEQYISITPSEIINVNYGQGEVFNVNIGVPIYQNYEEYDLKAVITGTLVKFDGTEISYREVQNIKLIVQAIAEEDSRFSLDEAEKALQKMKEAGFNVEDAERLYEEAVIKINSNRNKQAKDLADELIVLSERSFEVDSLIRKIMGVLTNPRKSNSLSKRGISGFAVEDYDVESYFLGHPSVEMVELALVAFERGDFDLAKQRADSAKSMLLFSIKGNLGLFILFYWPFILLGIFFLFIGGIVGSNQYKKSSITRKIGSLNNKEANVKKLIGDSQKKYFKGNMSAGEYNDVVDQHKVELSKIKKVRIGLRNQRIKMLKPREIAQDLKLERINIESEIKKIQTGYYKTRKISEKEYKLQFELLNERLAEIEEERTTLQLLNSKKKIKKILEKSVHKESEISIRKARKDLNKKIKKKRNKKFKIPKFKSKNLKKIKSKFVVKEVRDKFVKKFNKLLWKVNLKKDKRGIVLIDSGVLDLIKKEASKMDCKGKWIHINHKKEELEK